jgi:hypothetical protein
MNRTTLCVAGFASALTAAAAMGACSAANSSGGFGGGSSEGTTEGAGNGSTNSNTGPTTTGTFVTSTGANPAGGTTTTGTGSTGCNSGPDDDNDGDGWTPRQGDCNDCDPNVNPGAIEVATMMGSGGGSGTPVDEDCDGQVDNVPQACDSGFAIDDANAFDAAKVIGVCNVASTNNTRGPGWSYGVVDAQWVRANGMPAAPGLQAGIMQQFGQNVIPQEGATMLVMSSGNARTPSEPNPCGKDSCYHRTGVGKPPNFPSLVPGCQGGPSTPINDDVGLELTLRAPTNATGYNFKFKFYSFEFAEYVCSEFNDQFIALVSPAPSGSQDGNISFDANHNPVSVNIGFFDVCNPNSGEVYAQACSGNCPSQPNPYCPSGDTDLLGTGFEGIWKARFAAGNNWGGATSWLESTAPVNGGDEFTIRFTIWDAGDQNLDSSVIVDGFEWIASGGTVAVGTGMIDGGVIH